MTVKSKTRVYENEKSSQLFPAAKRYKRKTDRLQAKSALLVCYVDKGERTLQFPDDEVLLKAARCLEKQGFDFFIAQGQLTHS